MKIIAFLTTFFLLSLEITFSQTTDSIIYTNKVEYLKKLKETREYIYPIRSKTPASFLNIPLGVYPEKEQVLLKVGNEIYIRFDGTGFTFKLTDLRDSIATFKRIDRTINFNYNIGAYHFNSDNEIYNYGNTIRKI